MPQKDISLTIHNYYACVYSLPQYSFENHTWCCQSYRLKFLCLQEKLAYAPILHQILQFTWFSSPSSFSIMIFNFSVIVTWHCCQSHLGLSTCSQLWWRESCFWLLHLALTAPYPHPRWQLATWSDHLTKKTPCCLLWFLWLECYSCSCIHTATQIASMWFCREKAIASLLHNSTVLLYSTHFHCSMIHRVCSIAKTTAYIPHLGMTMTITFFLQRWRTHVHLTIVLCMRVLQWSH